MSDSQIDPERARAALWTRLRTVRVQPLRLLNWAGWVVVAAAFIRSARRRR
jgi:hypothetical protein